MTVYRCPSCSGGFPEPGRKRTNDGTVLTCPWCGEAMDGSSSTSGLLTGGTPAPSTVPDNTTESGDLVGAGQDDGPLLDPRPDVSDSPLPGSKGEQDTEIRGVDE